MGNTGHGFHQKEVGPAQEAKQKGSVRKTMVYFFILENLISHPMGQKVK
jgi:hypothetical protein